MIVAAIIVNVKFFGRKNSWALSFLLGGIGGIITFFKVPKFIIWVTVSKVCLDFSFTIAYEYTAEVYNTMIRTFGLGMASAFSRIGAIVMPWIGIYISNIGIYIPYLIFGIFSFIAGIVTFFLPYDTKDKELDSNKYVVND